MVEEPGLWSLSVLEPVATRTSCHSPLSESQSPHLQTGIMTEQHRDRCGDPIKHLAPLGSWVVLSKRDQPGQLPLPAMLPGLVLVGRKGVLPQ